MHNATMTAGTQPMGPPLAEQMIQAARICWFSGAVGPLEVWMASDIADELIREQRPGLADPDGDWVLPIPDTPVSFGNSPLRLKQHWAVPPHRWYVMQQDTPKLKPSSDGPTALGQLTLPEGSGNG